MDLSPSRATLVDLPAELIWKIINNLTLPDDEGLYPEYAMKWSPLHDRSIKALCRSSKLFVPFCQSVLFETMVMQPRKTYLPGAQVRNDGGSDIWFALLLEESPHIAKYVRKLTYRVPYHNPVVHDYIIDALRLMTKVEDLHLGTTGYNGRNKNQKDPMELELCGEAHALKDFHHARAIMSLLQGSELKRLTLENVRLPLSVLSSTSATALTLTTLKFHENAKVVKCRRGSTAREALDALVETLDPTDSVKARTMLDSSAFNLTNIKSLTIGPTDFPEYLSKETERLLQHFTHLESFQLNGPASGDAFNPQVALSALPVQAETMNLTRLSFSMDNIAELRWEEEEEPEMTIRNPLHGLPEHLRNISHGIFNNVEVLTIRVRIWKCDEPSSLTDHDDFGLDGSNVTDEWDDLENLILRGPQCIFPKLRKLGVRIFWNDMDLFDPELSTEEVGDVFEIDILDKHFERLQEMDGLDVDLRAEWEDLVVPVKVIHESRYTVDVRWSDLLADEETTDEDCEDTTDSALDDCDTAYANTSRAWIRMMLWPQA